jgi:hypothetical protein
MASVRNTPSVSTTPIKPNTDAAATEQIDQTRDTGTADGVKKFVAKYGEDMVDVGEMGLRMVGVAGHETGDVVRAAGAATGAVLEALHPTPPASTMSQVGGAVLKNLGRGAGVAGAAYAAYQGFTDNTFDSTGAKVANGAAQLALGAVYMTTPVGWVLGGVELATGGAVSGSLTGAVALGQSVLTGDDKALNAWKADCRSGEHGWLLSDISNGTLSQRPAKIAQGIADGATVAAHAAVKGATVAAHAVGSAISTANTAVNNAVNNAVAGAEKAVSSAASNVASTASSWVSSGWNALAHAW